MYINFEKFFDTKGLPQSVANLTQRDIIGNATCSVATLRSGFVQLIAQYSPAQKRQFPIAAGLLNNDAIADEDAELNAADRSHEVLLSDILFAPGRAISIDAGRALYDAHRQTGANFADSEEYSDLPNYSEGYIHYRLTDSSGFVYGFRVLSDISYYEGNDTNSWPNTAFVQFLYNDIWYNLLFWDATEKTFKTLVRLVPINAETFEKEEHGVYYTLQWTTLYQIGLSVAASANVNEAICEVSRACLSLRPKENMNMLRAKYNQNSAKVYDSARKFVSQCADLVSTGFQGIASVFAYITQFIKRLSQSDTTKPTLGFTDNANLIPKDFIGGVISAIAKIVSAILNVLVLALSGLWRALVAAVTVIGSLVSDVYTSATGTQYSSMVTGENDIESAMSYLDVWPFAPFKGSWDNTASFSQLSGFFEEYGTCMFVHVSGGVLFVGPGEYDDAGVITKWNWEFHPYVRTFNSSWPGLVNPDPSVPVFFNFNVADQITTTSGDVVVGLNLSGFGDPQTDFFKNYAEKYLLKTGAPDQDGYASSDTDFLLRMGMVVCTVSFLLSHAYYKWELDPAYGNCWVAVTEYFTGTDWYIESYQHFIMIFTQLLVVGLGGPITQNNTWNSWDRLLPIIAYWSDAQQYEFKCYANDEQQQHYGLWNFYINNDSEYSFNLLADGKLGTVDGSVDLPAPLPEQIQFAARPPKFSAGGFWRAIAIAAAIGAAVAITFVLAKVGFKKLTQQRRADNIIDTNKKRDTYTKAKQGLRPNAQTGEDESYDVNSAEGKQYLESCWKDYKSSVRRSNFEAMFIGGTRFDVGSFYGDAEASDIDVSSAQSLLDSSAYDSVTAGEEVDSSAPYDAVVVQLIKGFTE